MDFETKQEKLRAKWNRKYWRDPEKSRAQHRAQRIKNLEARRAQNRKWQFDQWAHRQEYMRAYYQKNKEKLKAKTKVQYLANKAQFWNYAQKRRALKMQAANNLLAIRSFAESVKAKRYAYCYYCGDRVKTSNIHFDHIIPLVKGGAHSIENLCVSCADCNLSKQDKLLSRWNKHPQLFLAL